MATTTAKEAASHKSDETAIQTSAVEPPHIEFPLYYQCHSATYPSELSGATPDGTSNFVYSLHASFPPMSEEERDRVSQLASELCAWTWENRETSNVHELISKELAYLVNEFGAFDYLRLLTPRFQEACSHFLSNIAEFVESKTDPQGFSEDLAEYCSALSEALFSGSPSIVQWLPVTQQISMMARFTRIPEAQASIGASMVSGLVYNCTFGNQNLPERVAEYIEGATLPEALDLLSGLETVGADAIANSTYAQEGFDRIEAAVKAIEHNAQEPLVRYQASVVLSRLREEDDQPSLSAIKRSNDASNGRIPDRPSPEQVALHERISRAVNSNAELQPGWRYAASARDALAIVDQSGTPRFMANCQLSKLPNGAPIALSTLSAIEAAIEDGFAGDVERIGRLLDYVEQNLFQKYSHDEASWTSVSQVLSESEWVALSQSRETISQLWAAHHRADSDIRKRAMARNEQASAEAVAALEAIVPSLRAAHAEGRLGTRISAQLNLFESAKSDNNADRAFRAACEIGEALAAICFPEKVRARYASLEQQQPAAHPEANSDIERAALLFLTLDEKHRKSWEVAEAERSLLDEASIPEAVYVAADLRAGYYQRLCEGGQFAEDLGNYVASLRDRFKSETVDLEFQSISLAAKEPSMQPFGVTYSKNLPLLLQRLHHPRMSAVIEEDLDIRLDQLSLRSQIHFLTYLAERDNESWARLRTSLRRQGPTATDMLECFLANAEGEKYCEPILRLAEVLTPEQAGPVFAKYNEIVEQTEHVREMLGRFPGYAANNRETGVAVVQNLLKRANRLLGEFAKQAEGDTAGLLGRLEHVRAEVVLFASTFKAAATQPQTLTDLSQVRGLEMQVVAGSELSDRDKDEIRRMHKENLGWYPAQLYQMAATGLEASFHDPQAKFYLLHLEGKLISCQRFKPTDDPEVMYHGTFLTTHEARGGGIGEAFFAAAVAKESETHILEGFVADGNSIIEHYVKSQGYMHHRRDDNYKGTGCGVMVIRHPKQGSSEIESIRSRAA